ncbi:MAG: LysR family transcriptional regulator [Polyangiales bacterium]
MGTIDWELLRTFEAVMRLGGVTRASRELGVSQSTVSRRLAQLEASAVSPLFRRSPVWGPSERGEALLAALGPMVDAALAANVALTADASVSGEVTLATVGELARWLLVPALPSFFAAHPELRLRILADARVQSLAAGEADLALRFARPERGELVARRVGVVRYALYGTRETSLEPSTPWLTLAGSLAALDEVRWATRVFEGRPPRLAVEDLEALGVAVRDGLGVALLPTTLVTRLPGLVELDGTRLGARAKRPPVRTLWLVTHRAKRKLPAVQAVATWVNGLFDDAPRSAVAEP